LKQKVFLFHLSDAKKRGLFRSRRSICRVAIVNAATKAIPTEVSAGICIEFSKPGSEKLSKDFLVHASDSLSIWHALIRVGKIFSTTVLKGLADSSPYWVMHAVSGGRISSNVSKLFSEKLKEV